MGEGERRKETEREIKKVQQERKEEEGGRRVRRRTGRVSSD